jgi:hypothetical protein
MSRKTLGRPIKTEYGLNTKPMWKDILIDSKVFSIPKQ